MRAAARWPHCRFRCALWRGLEQLEGALEKALAALLRVRPTLTTRPR